MATNRMYLVHRPSMIGVYIGSRFGANWRIIQQDTGLTIATLFKRIFEIGDGDYYETAPNRVNYISEETGGLLIDDFVIMKEDDCNSNSIKLLDITEITKNLSNHIL